MRFVAPLRLAPLPGILTEASEAACQMVMHDPHAQVLVCEAALIGSASHLACCKARMRCRRYANTHWA
jgi:hypothetical protein